MFQLPLFPLNTVLFPGMILPLHIFETRYKRMINQCLEGDRLFGVVLIRNGSEALGPLAEPYFIGCTARIIDSQALEEGRLQLTTLGERRFRVQRLMENQSYLVGEVQYHPHYKDTPDKLPLAVEQLTPKVRQYIHLLNQIEEVDINPENVPQDPLSFAYFAAALLQMPPVEKQNLLETENTTELLSSINQVYARETAFLRAIIERGNNQSITPISHN